MAMNFAELKNNRTTHLSKLTEKLNQASGSPKQADDRFWQPTVDKAGNGYAVIRFLPESKGEDVPFVRVWDHGFKGAGGWYIENSLTTIGQQDPVSEYNSELWNASTDDNSPGRKQARAQKRRLQFYSNIVVVEDSAHPENNGKVFLYRYGKKIFDKLNDIMNPKFPDEAPVNPFDLWSGANFKLKIRNVEGYRNYDRSEFDKPYPISDNEEMIQKIYESEFSLKPFIDPANFKPYAELKAKLTKVLGGKPTLASVSEADSREAATPVIKSLPKAEDEDVTTEEDESDEFFKKLKTLADK